MLPWSEAPADANDRRDEGIDVERDRDITDPAVVEEMEREIEAAIRPPTVAERRFRLSVRLLIQEWMVRPTPQPAPPERSREPDPR